jgi:ribulose-5-phosphate 4-epimerase/fuculose-1-phosphate aldolase
MSGSVSVRSGEAVLITADDAGKGLMAPQDTVMVDLSEGLPLIGETEWPSNDTATHLALYRRLPDCGAVICTHLPSTETRAPWRMAEKVAAALDPSSDGIPPALLIQPDGVVAWGRDTEEALSRLACAAHLDHPPRADSAAGKPLPIQVSVR